MQPRPQALGCSRHQSPKGAVVNKFESVKRALGKPAFETSDVALYLGDCTDYMSRIFGSPIDLTITSPPYNIGKEYEQNLPLAEYVAWCGKWMSQVHAVTESDGSFWLNLGYVPIESQGRAVPLPYLLWDQSPFFLQQEVVWQYGAGVAARRAFSPRNEKFLWYVKNPANYHFDLDSVRDPDVKYPNQKKNGKLRCNPLGKNPGDVWSVAKVTSGSGRASPERTAHPAQYPEAVIERVVKASSEPGDVVLDPFLGSGTTAVVARSLGRKCIGFELRADYLETAIKRLENWNSQEQFPV